MNSCVFKPLISIAILMSSVAQAADYVIHDRLEILKPINLESMWMSLIILLCEPTR